MSDIVIKLIPAPLGVMPEVTEKNEIEKAVRGLGIHYEGLKVWITEDLQFIDCGENLEYIRCRYCHEDALRWWGEAMNGSAESGFENRHIVTPCCGRHTTLEQLEYCLDTGFARFCIELKNPEKVTDADIVELGAELGVTFQRITARY